MTPLQTVIRGTLKADGTVELDEKPNLPPGRVQVILTHEEPAPNRKGTLEVLQRIRQEQESRGFKGRTKEEIDAALNEIRNEWDYRTE
jgi:hypothetical protein